MDDDNGLPPVAHGAGTKRPARVAPRMTLPPLPSSGNSGAFFDKKREREKNENECELYVAFLSSFSATHLFYQHTARMAVACRRVCTAASAVGYYLRAQNQLSETASLRSRRDFPTGAPYTRIFQEIVIA